VFDGVNAIFNNISAISWQSILLVDETGGPASLLAAIQLIKLI
jgi:hypothetical protein